MPEFEELRLTVTLIDNASTGLATLRQNLRALGGQENRDALARMQKEVEALGVKMGQTREHAAKTSSAVQSMARSMGAAMAAYAGGLISNFMIEGLRKFTDEVIRLDNTAKTFGIGGANLKAIVEQMKMAGVDPNAASQAVANFQTALAEISRIGSKAREDLLRTTSDPAAMEAFLRNITGMAGRGETAQALTEALRAARSVYAAEMERTRKETGTANMAMAAELTNRFLSTLKLDPSVAAQIINENFAGATAAEEAEYKKRLDIAKSFNAEMRKVDREYNEFITALQAGLIPLLQALNRELGTTGESWGKAFGENASKEIAKVAKEILYIYKLITNPKQTIAEGMDPRWQKLMGVETSEENKKKWEEKWASGDYNVLDTFTKRPDWGTPMFPKSDAPAAPPAASFNERFPTLPPGVGSDPSRRDAPGSTSPNFHRMSYSGGDSGYSSSSGGASAFTRAIRTGVFEGMVDFKNYLSGGGGGGGGGGGAPAGFQRASYSPDGGGSSGFQMPGGGGLPSNINIPGEGGRGGGGGGAPNGSSVGPGTGAGAGNTPAGARGGGAAPGSRAQEAIEYFKSQGWSHEQAAGIAANLHAESKFQTGARGDGGRASGIAQWHPDRQRAIERQFGKPISQMSYQEQLAAVNWELNNTEKGAGDKLRGTKTAREAGAAVSRYYERPQRTGHEMSVRGAQAEQFAAQPAPPQASSVGPGTGAGAGDTPASGGAAGRDTGHVDEAQGKVAGIRKLALDPRLRSALDYAGAQTGLTARVTSGGQDPHGPRTGSHRHNFGKAGDFNLLDEKGNVVGPDDPRALKFTEEAARAGVIGGGASYMSDPNKIHLDIAGGRGGQKGAYAGSRAFRSAMARGIEGQSSFDRSVLDSNASNETRVTGTGKLSVDVKAPRGTKVEAEGGGLFKKTEIDRQTQMEPAQSAPRRGGDDEQLSI